MSSTVRSPPLPVTGSCDSLPTVQATKIAMGRLNLNRTSLARRLKGERRTVKQWLKGETTPNVGTLLQDPEFCREYCRALAEVLAEDLAQQVGRAA